ESEVERRARAVVLAHGMDRFRPTGAAEVVVERLRCEELARLVALTEVERVGVGADHQLRQAVGLREEEPVPVGEAELRVRAEESLPRRDDVEARQPLDALRVVQRQAVRAASAAVVAAHEKTLEAEL